MPRITRNSAAVLVLTMLTILATSTVAGAWEHEREGFYLGLNAGVGCSGIEFEKSNVQYKLEQQTGFLSGIRFGYGINNSFLVGIEASGFMKDRNDSELELSTVVMAVTWYPQESGFFVRVGVGGGEAVFDTKIENRRFDREETGIAGVFSFGYEHRVTRTFAIGVSFEGHGIAVDDFDDYKEMGIGFGGVTAQLNWFL